MVVKTMTSKTILVNQKVDVQMLEVTMSDLIRREDVIEALYQAIWTPLIGTFTDSMSLAIAMANNLPSAEPEQKKGEWIDEKINSYTSRTYCSKCG